MGYHSGTPDSASLATQQADGQTDLVTPATRTAAEALAAAGYSAFIGDGSDTDRTADLNAAMQAVYDAGGNSLVIVGKCRIDGQLTLPNNGAGIPRQGYFRLTGLGSSANGTWGTLPDAPSVLDLRYDSPTAKIDTRGIGLFEIDHLVLMDGGSDSAAFVQTTNTSLYAHDMAIIGTGWGPAAVNDAFVLGGTTEDIGDAADAPFQGYTTIIQRVWFDQIRRGVHLRRWANHVQVLDNTWSISCGGDAAILTDGSGSLLGGLIARGNLIQCTYYMHPIKLTNSTIHALLENNFWDGQVYGVTEATNAATAALTTASTANMRSGQTVHITLATGAWVGMNGDHVATVIDGTHFSIPFDSTELGAFPGASWWGTASYHYADATSGYNTIIEGHGDPGFPIISGDGSALQTIVTGRSGYASQFPQGINTPQITGLSNLSASGNVTAGTSANQSVVKVFGALALNKSPIIHLLRSGVNEAMIGIHPSGLGTILAQCSAYTDAALQAGAALMWDGATTGGTRIMIWDTATGALQRVSVGDNDSGGTGYRLLRIPNTP